MEIEKKFSQCGDYNILETLGSGYHAKVKLGEKNGLKVAIKIFKKDHDTAQNIKALTNEILILQKLNHPNLVNLIEFSNALPYRRKNGKIEQRVCIILELAQGGELFEYISLSGRFSQEVSRFYFKQLLDAMVYMTDKGICHRDLKLENILLDEQFNLKVADFGFAKVMEAAKLKTNLGTPGYMAPEIVAKKEYNGTKADIFSAGVILFILHAGSPPFSQASEKDSYFRLLLTNKQDQFWNYHLRYKGGNPEFFPQDFRNLINGMLAPNPDQRFTLEQCLKHPWTLGQTATLQQIQGEFKKRYERVQADILASKMKKQAQKNNNNQQKGAIGVFRAIVGECDEEDFTQVIQKYNLTFDEKRQITPGKDTGLTNDLLLCQDPKFILCYLLKYCKKFNATVDKIHESKYKINFLEEEVKEVQEEENQEEDQEEVQEQEEEEVQEKLNFSIELVDYDNELIKLNVNRLSGNYFQFKQIYSRIKQVISLIYNPPLNQQVQQQ
ncbi:unnamed protein product [Paramecium sonneborni]|uniref:non-specific serine/threonine protein kinase n=1 Tax=Paramecium sonneborni TaxID=65129 RepID=A0A8S1RDC1_9CILI|nr:unnamed protein product [Paramecium sonneborni]